MSKDNFCFWPKISKTKKLPLKVKKHFLTHKECPDLDFKLSKDQFCFWSHFSKLKNLTKKWPFNIQKSKISLKSQNVRKLTPPKYAHWFQNDLQNFQNSKIKLKNYPFKSKNLNKPQITKCQKSDLPQIYPLIPKQLMKFSKLKNQTNKWPLQIQKP